MEKLLDNGFKQDWDWVIGDRGELLWHGKPDLNFNGSIKENRRSPDFTGYYALPNLFLWGGLSLILILDAFQRGRIFLGVLYILLGMVLPFLGDWFFYYKHSKTEYVISQKAVFFKVFNGWKYRIFTIPMENIISVNLVGNNDKRGTLHIITEEKVEFRTFDLENRRKRDHPTLEFVEQSKLAYKIIQNQIKKNPPRKLIYKPPVFTDWQLQVFQLFICGAIVSFLFIGAKFYILPLIEEGPSIIGYSIYFYLICLTSLVLSLIRTFKEKELKTEVAYPIIALNLWLILFSVIFYAFMFG